MPTHTTDHICARHAICFRCFKAGVERTRARQDAWAQRSLPMLESTARGQFLALRLYLADDGLAAEGHATWSLLSRACHHHPYDLQPSRDEVLGWIDAAERFHGGLQSASHDIRER